MGTTTRVLGYVLILLIDEYPPFRLRSWINPAARRPRSTCKDDPKEGT
jgi:hypothetical protein